MKRRDRRGLLNDYCAAVALARGSLRLAARRRAVKSRLAVSYQSIVAADLLRWVAHREQRQSIERRLLACTRPPDIARGAPSQVLILSNPGGREPAPTADRWISFRVPGRGASAGPETELRGVNEL